MTRDRVAGDEFPLTQDFLAQMLGVRRAGVNMAMGMIARAGLITYLRGKIRILNRAALEGVS
jgi:CRP-like cAMP-binding protein